MTIGMHLARASRRGRGASGRLDQLREFPELRQAILGDRALLALYDVDL